jgi:hypothetical protein
MIGPAHKMRNQSDKKVMMNRLIFKIKQSDNKELLIGPAHKMKPKR